MAASGTRRTRATLLPVMDAAELPAAFTDRMRQAIARHELSVVFQPQADAESGVLTGFEALVRWRLPDGTMVPPDIFVPMAEGGDGILVLGEWVLRRACETAARWRSAGLTEVPVSVNASPRQFESPGFARTVLGILAQTGLPAASLKLELTETALFDGSAQAHDTMMALRGAGVSLVLDDFGTGYSSLALLRRVPVEALKIDKQFVQAMVDDRDAAAIVHAIIALAHALGLQVIAEGIETPEQALFLRAYRCDRIQGYLLSHPLSEREVSAFMALRAGRRPSE